MNIILADVYTQVFTNISPNSSTVQRSLAQTAQKSIESKVQQKSAAFTLIWLSKDEKSANEYLVLALPGNMQADG